MPYLPTDSPPTPSNRTDDPSTSPRRSRTPSRQVRPRTAAAALGGAAVGALLIWSVAVPLRGLELELAAAGQSVGPASIVVAVLAAGAAAWLLLALLSRLPHGRTVWTAVGTAVLLLSLAGPALSGAVGAVLVVLELMHLVVGLILLLGLGRSAVPAPGAGRTVTVEAS